MDGDKFDDGENNDMPMTSEKITALRTLEPTNTVASTCSQGITTSKTPAPYVCTRCGTRPLLNEHDNIRDHVLHLIEVHDFHIMYYEEPMVLRLTTGGKGYNAFGGPHY